MAPCGTHLTCGSVFSTRQQAHFANVYDQHERRAETHENAAQFIQLPLSVQRPGQTSLRSVGDAGGRRSTDPGSGFGRTRAARPPAPRALFLKPASKRPQTSSSSPARNASYLRMNSLAAGLSVLRPPPTPPLTEQPHDERHLQLLDALPCRAMRHTQRTRGGNERSMFGDLLAAM
jgi:hypothetical protein